MRAAMYEASSVPALAVVWVVDVVVVAEIAAVTPKLMPAVHRAMLSC